jgi:hypothetical protein
MSKAAAIHAAISLQLCSENKTVDLRQALGATPPGGAAAYTPDTIRAFLANVAFRLRADSPPLAFKWNEVNHERCLTDPLWVVELAIAEATSDIPQAASTK